MSPHYFIKGFRCFFHGFCKTARAIITTPIVEWISKDPQKAQVPFTGRAQGADYCLKCGWPISSGVAEYKATNGDVMRFSLPLSDPEHTIGEFKKCFRIVSHDRLVQIKHLQEIGLILSIRIFCDACNPEDAQCNGCRLFDTGKGKSRSCGNNSGKEREDCQAPQEL